MVHAVGLSAVGDNVRVSSSRAVGTKGVPRAQREQLILDAATFEFGRFGYAGAALFWGDERRQGRPGAGDGRGQSRHR